MVVPLILFDQVHVEAVEEIAKFLERSGAPLGVDGRRKFEGRR